MIAVQFSVLHNLHGLLTQIVPVDKTERLEVYDKMLSQFEYSRALDYVLRPHFFKKKPDVTIQVIQELIRQVVSRFMVNSLYFSYHANSRFTVHIFLRNFLPNICWAGLGM